MNRPLIWAHRGASARAPENTFSAFAAAVADGADGLELDIQLSRDGTPVVMHDESVDRTTDGAGLVRELRLQELQALDAGAWFSPAFAGEKVPTLEQVLVNFAGRLFLNLEVKQRQAGLVVLEMLRDCPRPEVLISSFDWSLLALLRRADPRIPLAVLLETRHWHRALCVARQIRAVSLHPRVDLLSRPLLASCRHRGVPVIPWTVDEPRIAQRLFRAGVAGVFSNHPLALSPPQSRP